MSPSRKIKIFKIIIFIITILLLVALTLYLFPIISKLFTEEGREAFKIEIENAGTMGILMLFGLQIAQIFLPILPGEPIEILAGMCYGTIGGVLFIIFSVFVTTTIIFFLVRKFGKEFVYGMCSKERVDKIENSKLFKNPRKLEYIMLILFLIPGTPKDILVYIAGLLPIKPLRFILISSFVRFPSIISSTIAGANLVEGNWQFSIMIYAITFAIVGIIVFIMQKVDKTNLTRNIIESASEKDK